MNILSSLFMALAGISNALMDISAENKFTNNKFNKDLGPNNDENKWKQPTEPGKRMWWYLWLKKPKYKESFIWSSTILVSFTDWWHRFQAMMLLFITLAIVCYVPTTVFVVKWLGWKTMFVPVLDFILFRVMFGLGFEPLYSYLKKKSDGEKM